MHQFLLAALVLSISPLALTSPVPQTTGADSCTTEALATETWTSLNSDKFLVDWTAANVTASTSNNVQTLASSFGAPNFFCGLDQLCNAGQPCLPVDLPAWHVLLAIQNWNNYMNSLNTAITFASAISSLTLPSIVTDFYPKPKDDITPLENLSKMFTTILGIVPFTGELATAVGLTSQGISFITGQLAVPAQTDLFLAWSDIGASLATVLTAYQSAVSTSLKTILDASVSKTNTGINSVIAGGAFLGSSQNFTETDLQSAVTSFISIFSIGLVLQAQKVFIYRFPSLCNENGAATLCVDDGTGAKAGYIILQADGDSNAVPMDDAAGLLVTKYGLTKEQVLRGPPGCFDHNGKVQLADPFVDAVPLDGATECVFNLLVCGQNDGTGWDSLERGIVDNCMVSQGLDI